MGLLLEKNLETGIGQSIKSLQGKGSINGGGPAEMPGLWGQGH